MSQQDPRTRFIVFVSGDGDEPPPTFAYTIGLFGMGHPELVVTGVDLQTAGGLLNELGDRIRTGAGERPLPAATRGLSARVPADLRRQVGPVSVGRRVRKPAGRAATTRQLARMIVVAPPGLLRLLRPGTPTTTKVGGR
jgi:hypothetical protein